MGDTEPLISEGLKEEPGQYGQGLVAKIEWHRETQIRISEKDAKQGYLTRFMMENPNLEVRARVYTTQKAMVMTVPHDSPSARPLLPRPFVVPQTFCGPVRPERDGRWNGEDGGADGERGDPPEAAALWGRVAAPRPGVPLDGL